MLLQLFLLLRGSLALPKGRRVSDAVLSLPLLRLLLLVLLLLLLLVLLLLLLLPLLLLGVKGCT